MYAPVPGGFKADKLRWPIAILFSFALLVVNGGSSLTSVINDFIATFYGLQLIFVNLIQVVYYPLYVAFSFVARYSYHVLGLHVTVFIGMVGSFIGMLISMLYADGFGYLLAGNIITSCASPFLFNYMTSVCARWFDKTNFNISMAVMGFLSGGGVALGMVIPAYKISNASQFGSRFGYIDGGWTMLTAAMTVIIFALFRSAPKTPPDEQSHEGGMRALVWPSLNKGWFPPHNFNVIWVTFAIYSIKSAVSWTSSSTYAHWMRIHDYNSDQVTLTTTLNQFISIFGPFLSGFILAKTEAYHILNIVLSVLATTAYALIIVFINNAIALYICISAFGFFAAAWSTSLFITITRLSFPLSEDASNSVMLIGANLITWPFGVLVSFEFMQYGLMWSFLGLLGVCCVLSIIMPFLGATFDPLRKPNKPTTV